MINHDVSHGHDSRSSSFSKLNFQDPALGYLPSSVAECRIDRKGTPVCCQGFSRAT